MYQNIFYDRSNDQIHLWDDVEGYKKFKYNRYAYVKDSNGTHTSLYGDRLRRVERFNRNSSDVFEGDVNELTRTLIDLYLDSDDISSGHRVMTFDIEVEMHTHEIDVNKAENYITSISFHDSKTNTYCALILDLDGILTMRRDGNRLVVPYRTEIDLLRGFMDAYKKIKPTILTGWNIDYFDVPYLYNRMVNVMGEDFANSLSPIGIVTKNRNTERYTIAGVSALDYLALYKNYNYSELPNYRLDTVGTIEVGIGKIAYDGNLDDLFKQDIEKFIEYNIVDVVIVVELDKKLQFIDLCRGICHVGHVPYEDFAFSSRYLEGALLCYLKRRNIVAPNKPISNSDETTQFAGAYVKDPIIGKHDWVYDLDLTSLYPSIIMTLNISPETKVTCIKNWDYKAFASGKTDQFLTEDGSITKENLALLFDNEKLTIATNGVMYRTDKVGCVPDILNEWFSKRVEYRKLEKQYGLSGDTDKYNFYKKRQLVQKILLNSMYGCLGLPSFRFYDKDNAESVTLTGQTVIQTTSHLANLKYNKELGGNPIILDCKSLTHTVYPNTNISVIRNGDLLNLVGSDVKVGDVLVHDNSQVIDIRTEMVAIDDGGNNDYTIYIDTDSIFLSAIPLLNHRYFGWKVLEPNEIAKYVNTIAGDMQDYINLFYNTFVKRVLNVNPETHRLEIKKEYVSKAGLWVSKKRYAQWIISDNGVPVDKLDVKGLDVKRSSFPKVFQKAMSTVLIQILKGSNETDVTRVIIDMKNAMSVSETSDVAKNTSIKELSKYLHKSRKRFTFVKGTPAHVKAAIAYNDMLDEFDAGFSYSKIRNGDKVKWVYLKNNPFGIDNIAFTGYLDPTSIMEFIKTYVDHEKMFNQEFKNKVQGIYNAVGWGSIMQDTTISKQFFNF